MKISATVWAQKKQETVCDFLLGVPLWWGGGYSVVNAFYCVTWYKTEKQRADHS